MNKLYALIIIAMLFVVVVVSGCTRQDQQQGGAGGPDDVNASIGLGSDINQLDEIQSDMNAPELEGIASDMDEVTGL